MSDLAISVRGISKQYARGAGRGPTLRSVLGGLRGRRGHAAPGADPDTFWALRDVSFDVRRGERVGIIGRNGAGKSTLLKVLSRVVYPTVGEARIRGRLTSLLEVGTGFNENMTGRENVYLNASIHGLTRREIEERFDEIVEFADVRAFLDTPVKRYSSGMQMRLAFAVAAHLDPDILLLDEVLAVGDLSFQRKCLERVEGLVSEGRTLLFVSHSLDAMTRFCTRVIWLDGGKIRRDGPAQEVVEAYLSEMIGVRSSRSWAPADPIAYAGQTATAGPPGGGGATGRDGAVPSRANGSANAELSLGSAADADARPGDEFVRLVAARVVNRDRQTVGSVPIDRPVGVEVTYDVLRAERNVQPSLHFKTANDQYIFVVAYTDPEHAYAAPRPGRYVATAWVPENLLNVGVTYVTVALNTPDPFQEHCVVERAVSFNAIEGLDAGGTARGLYARDFPGLVRPLLRWETRVLGPVAAGASAP
jgi:lipopolysaccharide transport system ATP-binding protein